MALKDEWKKTGKDLGNAFASLGKNTGKSIETGADKAGELIGKKNEDGEDSNVFNDGSWRSTGSKLGHAFTGLGKTLVSSAKAGTEKLDSKVNKKKDGED